MICPHCKQEHDELYNEWTKTIFKCKHCGRFFKEKISEHKIKSILYAEMVND